MNILVYDVAADAGGAAAILEHFYSIHRKDEANQYYYLLSTYHMDDTKNITVINVPRVKPGRWFSRIIFDQIGARKYIRKYKIDEVFSLQNNILPCFHGRQTIYVHNALPFSEKRYGFLQNRYLWIYQNIIGKVIKKSIKKANKVIVQTEWMKKEICKQTRVRPDKIEVKFPALSYDSGMHYTEQAIPTFFYPANPNEFKNHKIILEACNHLKVRNITGYKVVFTLKGNENQYIAGLKRVCDTNGLPIHWVGLLSKEEVFSSYSKSILLFPSYIETIGLPILEAISVGSPIIAADLHYAREIVGEYDNVSFFSPDDSESLSKIMENQIRRTVDE